jgi:hypothetical protein
MVEPDCWARTGSEIRARARRNNAFFTGMIGITAVNLWKNI